MSMEIMNKGNPLVSVIISCYNHEHYIEDCVRSAIAQTYPAIELLVVDDGSTDSSPEILTRLADELNFDLRLQANKGLSTTLNETIVRSSGKYVCVMGSDDVMMPDKTAKQVSIMEQNADVAVCGGNAVFIDSMGNPVRNRRALPGYREISFDHLFLGSGPGIIAPTAMIRRSVLDGVGMYDPNIPLEDLYMWLKITHRGFRMVGLEDTLIYYRKHASHTYKDARYMIHSIIKTIAPYSDHLRYSRVRAEFLKSAMVSAAKQNNPSLFAELTGQLGLRHRITPKVLRSKWILFSKRFAS